jgi:hypothetical protein
VEACQNTSTVALRVVEGDKKENGGWMYNLVTLSLGDINTGTWSSRFWVGRKADDFALSKKIIVAKSNEVKLESNLE